MPELPEVETIKRGLSSKIVGKKIVDIDILNAKSFVGDKLSVISYEVISIERRAKLIRIKLSNDLNLLFHLKLTGQLIYQPLVVSSKPLANFTRLIFTFDDKSKLFFNDMRKFGWCKVLTDGDIDKIFSTEYGLEPFDKDFTTEYLIDKTKRIPNRKIKQFLLDQTIIAGIGNIYADETLFDAGLMPTRRIKDIKSSEWKVLVSSIQKILTLAIAHGGTTDSDYLNSDGKKGGMQNYLKVYHCTGQKCFGCGGIVKRMIVGGRGTHFCSTCQH